MRALLVLAFALVSCAPGEESVESSVRRQLAERERPASVLSDPEAAALTEHPESRRALREALRELAVAEPLVMVRPDEPGEPLVLDGRLVDENDGRPLAGALVQIVQADLGGLYFPEPDSDFNPRLFGFVRTSAKGEFRVRTIRPSGYADGDGVMVGAHLHYNAEAEGYRPFGGEIALADDPDWTAEALDEARGFGFPVTRPTRGADGTWRVKATIPMQPDP